MKGRPLLQLGHAILHPRMPRMRYFRLTLQHNDGTSDSWLHQLPVLGFIFGKYNLNTIKQFLIPHLLGEEEEVDEAEEKNNNKEEEDGVASCFVTNRQKNFKYLSTDKLKFLDMINDIARSSTTIRI